MTVNWTPHRFSGGVLALDVANTVVLRGSPEKRFDRFADAGEIVRFAAAAGRHRADEFGGRMLAIPDDAEAIAPRVIALREATDALFRDAAGGAPLRTPLLVPFLGAAREALEGSDEPFPALPRASLRPLAFTAALGLSALSLLDGECRARVRICANCGWLFADRSRNRSRVWCDMAVCGNRRKAQRHHRKQRGTQEARHD